MDDCISMTAGNDSPYYVYIMSNSTGTTYTGVTNNIVRRVEEHKTRKFPGFTKKYKINRLVYYEEHQYINDAIYREKQIKGFRREKKRDLITFLNPKWEDLSAGWFEQASAPADAAVELAL